MANKKLQDHPGFNALTGEVVVGSREEAVALVGERAAADKVEQRGVAFVIRDTPDLDKNETLVPQMGTATATAPVVGPAPGAPAPSEDGKALTTQPADNGK